MKVVVLPADIQDRDGAKTLLSGIRKKFRRLKLIWADGGYAGKLVGWVKIKLKCVLEIVKRSDAQKGFIVLPRRWVVERTFGWFGRYRRLSKDYEQLERVCESMLFLASINLMVHRIRPG